MKIFCGIPTLGEISVGNVRNMEIWKADPELDIEFFITEGIVPGACARNQIHKSFIESDADVLFLLDERTVPAPWMLKKLLSYDKDFVAAAVQTIKLGHQREPYLSTLGFRWNDVLKGYQPEFSIGLTEVHVSSVSCSVIKREVMEKVERPAFVDVLTGEYGESCTTNDLHFCELIREAGYRVWVDYGCLCRHFQRLETKTINRMLRRAKRDGSDIYGTEAWCD